MSINVRISYRWITKGCFFSAVILALFFSLFPGRSGSVDSKTWFPIELGLEFQDSLGLPLRIEFSPQQPSVPRDWNQDDREEYADTMLKFLFLCGMGALLFILFLQKRYLYRVNERLLQEKMLYRSIVEDQMEIIFRFRSDFTIVFINDVFCDFLGKKRDELMNRSLLELIPQRDQKELFQNLAGLSPSRPVHHCEYRCHRLHRAPSWHYWTLRAIYGVGGELAEYQATGQDITSLKQTYLALLRTKEEAETANRAKSDFLARMSHELRTPLNSVIGFTSILLKNKDRKFGNRDLNFLNRILSNGRHLLELINQILDISKIESGKMEIQFSTVYLDRLVSNVIEEMLDPVRSKKIDLMREIPEMVAPIQTDENKLRQVLINLIGNAVKFTEKGSILVRVVVHPHTRCPWRLDVIDTGIGISEDRLQTIFEPFSQADSSTSRLYGGTGLGLTISKSLCELLGYRLEAESHFGEGSCFRIILNENPTSAPPSRNDIPTKVESPFPVRNTPRDGISSLVGITILIIDDGQDDRFLLQNMVEEFGCKAITASSGAEGLELASRYHPDIILIDVLMPEMNGWEVLINLKSDPNLAHIPMVIVSIVACDLKGVSLGLVDLLDKPVRPEKLYEVLEQNVRKRRGTVLLVEENRELCRCFQSVLDEVKMAYYLVPDSEEALHILETKSLDLVVVNLAIQDRAGTLFLETLRRDARYHHLPVYVTASPDKMDTIRDIGINIDGVLHPGDRLEKEFRSLVLRIVKL